MDQNVPEELIDAGRGYEALFVPALFEPWTEHLVELAGVCEGSRVLDVACGTGVLARSALAKAGANGRVVGVDAGPGMLVAAQELEPTIDWILCGAEDLEFDDAAFDCVISQFGMMFFDDRKKSAEEMFRVLRPGGSLAVAVWRSVDHNPAYADIISVLEEHVGHTAADSLRLPFSLGNPDEVTAVLESWIAPVIDWTPRIAYFYAIGGENESEKTQALERQAQGRGGNCSAQGRAAGRGEPSDRPAGSCTQCLEGVLSRRWCGRFPG